MVLQIAIGVSIAPSAVPDHLGLIVNSRSDVAVAAELAPFEAGSHGRQGV